jgi:hypothetical protein
MKLNKKTVGAVIFTFFILLLFLSKTIYAYNLPVVTGTKPSRGTLSKLETSSGIAGWADMEHIYTEVSGSVGCILVKEGDAVTKGQALFEMNYDTASAERKLIESRNTINKLEGEIYNIQSRLNTIRDTLNRSASFESGSSFSGYAGYIALEINKAQFAFRNAKLSYELGFQSKNDMLNAENNLKTVLLKYEAEAEELSYSLGSKILERNNLMLTVEASQEALEKYQNNAVITAPADGIIINLPVEKSSYIGEHVLLGSIGIGEEFTVTCPVSLDNNFILPGDTCELSNSSHVFIGTVNRVKPSDQRKIVTISVVSKEITDGETFDITFEKNSAASFTLIANSAINQDNDGYFLYQIKRRKGIMGDEYYLERLNIFIGDSDYQNTAVIRGIIFFEPIVLVSDKSLSSGITIALKNPEDFFES